MPAWLPVLLLGVLLPVQPASAEVEEGSRADEFNAVSTFPQFAPLPDSALSDAPLMLRGAIEQITGATMPGAHVLIWAWPANDQVLAMPDGAELEMTPIARTVADGSGSYELRSTVTDVLRALAGPDGIDIELDVFHGDRHYTHLSQITPTSDGGWIRNLSGLSETVGEVVEEAGNLLNLTLDRTEAALERGLNLTGDAPTAAGERTYRKPAPPFCTNFEKVGTRRVMETVATAVARRGVTSKVTYSKNATTESSTGGSLGGLFSINGSRSRTVGFGAEYRPQTGTKRKIVNVEYQIESVHVVLRRACARDFRGNEDVLFVTSPAGSTGGGAIIPSRYPLWSCSASDKRSARANDFSGVTADQERSAAYGGAFTFAPIPGSGFTGAALSGYSESVSVRYEFNPPRGKKSYWCGHTSTPVDRGQRVQGFVQ